MNVTIQRNCYKNIVSISVLLLCVEMTFEDRTTIPIYQYLLCIFGKITYKFYSLANVYFYM